MGERRRLDGSVTIRCPQCGQGRRRDGRYDGPTMSVSPVSSPLSFRERVNKILFVAQSLCILVTTTCNHVGEMADREGPSREERGNPLGQTF
jgi:hypothetical protein